MDHDTIWGIERDTRHTSRQRGDGDRYRGAGGFAAGIILLAWIAFGSVILLGSFGVIDAQIGDLWPVILILAGANLLLSSGRYRLHSAGNRDHETPTD